MFFNQLKLFFNLNEHLKEFDIIRKNYKNEKIMNMKWKFKVLRIQKEI